MSTPAPTSQAPAISKLFKSPKELVVLVVVAVVFVVIVWKTYLSKPSTAEVAELNPAAVESAGGILAPAAARPGRLAAVPAPGSAALAAAAPADALARLDLETPRAGGEAALPAALPRDPFAMSPSMTAALSKSLKITTPPPPKPPEAQEFTTATPEELQAALVKIPGADEAASKGLNLTAVLITDSWQGAVINGKVIPAGRTVLGFTLVKVLDDRITIERGACRVTLLVRPPSPMDTEDGDAPQRRTPK